MTDAATARKRKNECIRCLKDYKYFLGQYGYIMGKNEDGATTGKIPFGLFEYQNEALDNLDSHQDTIILKARQLGLSWTVAGYALWLAMFHKYQRVLIISVNDTEAQVFLEKVKFIFDNLPEWMKVSVYKRNESVLWFGTRLGYDTDEVGGINSKIESIPTSKTAGTSRSLNLAIIDECAKVDFVDTIWKSLQPALSATGGKAVFISTMTTESTGEFFEEMWKDAKDKKNSFFPFFIPFSRYPGHNDEWLKSQLSRMPASKRARAKQEYPRTEEEAFQAAGGRYFDQKVLENFHKPRLKPPIKIGYLVEYGDNLDFRVDTDNGAISVWHEPEPFEDYVVGGDPAEGIGQDYTMLSVIRKRDLALCARFRSNTTDSELAAKEAAKLGRWYNYALVAVENNNNHGGMVNICLKNIYSNIYYHEVVDRDNSTPVTRWGWHTDGQTRTPMLDNLAKIVDNGALEINDDEFYDELREYIVDKTGRGDHKKGKHDDYIFSVGIACWVIRVNPFYDRKKEAEKRAKKSNVRPRGGY